MSVSAEMKNQRADRPMARFVVMYETPRCAA